EGYTNVNRIGKATTRINIMTLTKRDLVTRISNETGLVQQQVLDVVQRTLDYIAESLSKGDKVELRNFGVFEVKIRKARVGRNPNSPATDVPIPERCVVKFKPGKEMRAEVIKMAPPKPPAASPPKVCRLRPSPPRHWLGGCPVFFLHKETESFPVH